MSTINAADLPAFMQTVAEKVKAGVILMKSECVCDLPTSIQFSGDILISGGLNAIDRITLRTSDPNVAVTNNGQDVTTTVAGASTNTTDGTEDDTGGESGSESTDESGSSDSSEASAQSGLESELTSEVALILQVGAEIGTEIGTSIESGYENGNSAGTQYTTHGQDNFNYEAYSYESDS